MILPSTERLCSTKKDIEKALDLPPGSLSFLDSDLLITAKVPATRPPAA